MSAHSRWLILFFGIGLNCNSPILEAMFAVFNTNIWQYLPDDYTIEEAFEPILDIINTRNNWTIDIDNGCHLKFKSCDQCSAFTLLTVTYTTSQIYEFNLRNGYYFGLHFHDGICIRAHIGKHLQIVRDIENQICFLTLKQQILKAKELLEQYRYE